MFGRAAGSWLSRSMLVPTPPSKAKDDPLYDDRMVRLLKNIPSDTPLDIRELVVQTNTRPAAHDANTRPTPDDLLKSYRIVEHLLKSSSNTVIVFDDVLTTGAHYVAMRRLLSMHLPGADILGFFVARRVL